MRKFSVLIPTFVEVTVEKVVVEVGLFAPPPILNKVKTNKKIYQEKEILKSKLLVLLNYTSMVWISSVLYSFKAYFLACSRWILRCVANCPEHVQNFFWMSFVLSIYDLCPGGKLSDFLFHWNFSNGYLIWNFMENLINFIDL